MPRRIRNVMGFVLTALTVGPVAASAQGGPPGDPLGPDLFMAIRDNNTAQVIELLSTGAQTEARNRLGFSPLMWASICGNEAIVRALIDARADIEGPSHYGTAITYATESGNQSLVKFLLDRGAKLETGRADGITPLMIAAGNNSQDVMRWLIAKKADVNAADTDGATALMYAARTGNVEAANILLAAGAKPNTADSHGRTALMYASMNGQAKTAKLLLQRGASPNLKDAKGATAMSLAMQYASDTKTSSTLRAFGAERYAEGAKPNGIKVGFPPAAAAREAAERSISLLEKTADYFSQNAGCVSCHHQGLGLMVTGMAKERGFRYDRSIADYELTRIRKEDESHAEQMKPVIGHPEMYKFVPGVDIGEFVPAVSFIYSGVAAHDIPANPALQGAAIILASQQAADGRWGFKIHREPIQSSEFTTTALAIRVLKAYFPKERASELDARLAKARQWLIATQPKTNEDRTFRLLALKWAGAPDAEIAKATAEVKKLQRKDGGWAQFADYRSDAYATGTTLYALNMAGMTAKDSVYQKGMSYLIRTQDEDGSWYVNKRAIQANTYFDSTFPHGESQYISYGATAWASMALMLGAEPAQQTASR